MGRGIFTSMAVAALTAILFAWPVAAWADLPITQIAITGSPAPDGSTFTSFGIPTADRETNLFTGLEPFWFQATASNGINGVYVYDGIANDYFTLADSTMTAPTGGTFSSFSDVSSGFGAVGFIATDSNNAQGAYIIGSIPLTLLVIPQTLTSVGVPLGNIQNISIMGGGMYGDVGGAIESDTGIYVTEGVNAPILLTANIATVPPGGSSPFTFFRPVSFKNAQADSNEDGINKVISAFRGTAGGIEGIYYQLDLTLSPLQNVASAGAKVPDSNGNPTPSTFTSFGNPVATSNEISFTAHYNTASGDQEGIFSYGPYTDNFTPVSLKVRQFVATGDVAPDSGGATFSGFSSLADGLFDQIFIANLSDGKQGLYADTTDPFYQTIQLIKIIESGDNLDGKVVSGIELSPDAAEIGLYGTPGDTAFEVDFTDGSQGLFYFTVPEPTSLCLVGFPLVLLPLRRRP